MRCPSQAELCLARSARNDRGTVTAEFAVVLPAVVLLIVVALAALQLIGLQVRAQAAAAGAARSLGRGDTATAHEAVAGVPGALLDSTTKGDLVCASVTVPAGIGALAGFTVSATSCALGDGQ